MNRPFLSNGFTEYSVNPFYILVLYQGEVPAGLRIVGLLHFSLQIT